jgi:hypothetical protein
MKFGTRRRTLLAKSLESRFSCVLASAISKFEREDFQRKNARKTNENRERFDALRAIDTRLSAIEAGNFFAWWELDLVFLADESGRCKYLEVARCDMCRRGVGRDAELRLLRPPS